jgi:hypothetical protein
MPRLSIMSAIASLTLSCIFSATARKPLWREPLCHAVVAVSEDFGKKQVSGQVPGTVINVKTHLNRHDLAHAV